MVHRPALEPARPGARTPCVLERRPGARGAGYGRGVATRVSGDKNFPAAEGVRKKKQSAIDRYPGLETPRDLGTRLVQPRLCLFWSVSYGPIGFNAMTLQLAPSSGNTLHDHPGRYWPGVGAV